MVHCVEHNQMYDVLAGEYCVYCGNPNFNQVKEDSFHTSKNVDFGISMSAVIIDKAGVVTNLKIYEGQESVGFGNGFHIDLNIPFETTAICLDVLPESYKEG